MFGFRKKKPAPPLCPSNLGIGAEAKAAFSNGSRSWCENVNLISLAVNVLKRGGYTAVGEKGWVHHPNSGFIIQPQLVAIKPLEDGGVQTTTTVQTNHPTFAPAGVFEYQHSTGDNIAASISQGLEQWMQMDFVTLLDALRPEPESCTGLEFDFPAKPDQPARSRRAVLGPVAHFMQEPPPGGQEIDPEVHPFCPCCLLTKSFDAFRAMIEGDGLYCLRLFAARGADGSPQADCRVNGEDFETGIEALRNYAKTWPPAGYEFRKQYVVLHPRAR